ncbi:MAG: uroporphyrinogen decarboxylase [Spirochaetia bacterium]|nr:uroporphyrinogen decarboxylase [Spirochaetia bacterium]
MSKENQPIIVRAMRGESTERIPFWYMRQAGRYLPEYNEIRRGKSFIEVMENPDLAFEVSMQPLRRFQMDAIIMFSDILTPIRAAGIPLHFEEKKGPVLEKIVQSESDLEIFRSFDAGRDCPYVTEILQRLSAEAQTMANRPAVLGFAGAPFTLASYLVEGGSTQKFEKTKACIFKQTDLFLKLSDVLTELTIAYLRMQIEAGADAVQIFDSWGGVLSPDHYGEFSAPFTKRIIESVQKMGKPVILFVGNSSHLLAQMNAQKPDVISLDWRITATRARAEIAPAIALQGNMDPLVLYGTPERTRIETLRVLEAFSDRRGYIFNLGHGIHPASLMENVQTMVDTVKSFKVS